MVVEVGVMEAGLLEVCLTRRVAASPDVVFGAWIKKEHLAKWWGPKGFTNPVCEVDARIGGAMMIDMRSPAGVIYPMTGRFVTIDPPHRLVFVTAAIDCATLSFGYVGWMVPEFGSADGAGCGALVWCELMELRVYL